MTVRASMWKHEPFTSGVPVPCALSVDRDAFAHIQEGLLPDGMEDKWFVYYEAPFLYWHRSWTGMPFYRLAWTEDELGAHVTEMLWAHEAAEDDEVKRAYQGQLADYLIHVLLLGVSRPLPRLPSGR